MTTRISIPAFALTLALSALLAACGSGSSSSTGSGSGGSPAGSSHLAVSPSLGLVRHATLRVLDLAGAELGRGNMDDSGRIELPVDVGSQGFIVELQGAAGASYYDEGMDAWLPLPAGTTLHAVSAEGRSQVAVTALTEIAYRRARHLANGGALSTALINQANAEIAGWLVKVPVAIDENGNETLPVEIPSVLDPAVPVDGDDVLQRSDTAGRYAIFLAGLARYAYIRAIEQDLPCIHDANCSPLLALIDDLAKDFSDGVLDDTDPDGAIASPFYLDGGNMSIQFVRHGNFYARNGFLPDQEIGVEFAGSYSLSCEGDAQPTLMRVLNTGEVGLSGPHGNIWLGKHSDPEKDLILEHTYEIKSTGKGFLVRGSHLIYGEPYYEMVPDAEVIASASGSVTMTLDGVVHRCSTTFTRGELYPAIPLFTTIVKDSNLICQTGIGGGPTSDTPVSFFPSNIEVKGVRRDETPESFQEYKHVTYKSAYPNSNVNSAEYWMYGDDHGDQPYVEIIRSGRDYGELLTNFDMSLTGHYGFGACQAPQPAI